MATLTMTAFGLENAAAASITILADKVEGRVSPTLYGQFDEFMYEAVKFGLNAEMVRDRGFEELPNAIGLPRYWERDPDDRNDDSALHFHWDDSVAYPASRSFTSADLSRPQPRSMTAGLTSMNSPVSCDRPATCCTK